MEDLRGKQEEVNKLPADVNDVEELEEEDDENFSFGFLIKNELGVNINLESLYGFKVIIRDFLTWCLIKNEIKF